MTMSKFNQSEHLHLISPYYLIFSFCYSMIDFLISQFGDDVYCSQPDLSWCGTIIYMHPIKAVVLHICEYLLAIGIVFSCLLHRTMRAMGYKTMASGGCSLRGSGGGGGGLIPPLASPSPFFLHNLYFFPPSSPPNLHWFIGCRGAGAHPAPP